MSIILARRQFGALQHRLFPVYFGSGIALSVALLALWVYAHPSVLVSVTSPTIGDVAQAYALAAVALSYSANYAFIGPLTARLVQQRYKLEANEGKTYTASDVSTTMKALNTKFDRVHSMSISTNMVAIVGLIFHALWIGNGGLA